MLKQDKKLTKKLEKMEKEGLEAARQQYIQQGPFDSSAS